MFKFYIILWILLPFAAIAGDEFFTVKEVINGKSFRLTTGDIVRLASIETPNVQEQGTPQHHGRSGEPLGEEAKQALASFITGRKVRIEYNPGKRDRHGRILGQVYDDKGIWIQGEMLRQGFAEVYSFSDDSHTLIERMLAAEKYAQQAKRGLWNDPYYRVIVPQEAEEFINRFKIVEGTIKSVHEYHDNIYINFSEHWKGNFAVFISHKNADAFSSLHLSSWIGKKVRVRGWIHYHNAPMIDINHPEQIEAES